MMPTVITYASKMAYGRLQFTRHRTLVQLRLVVCILLSRETTVCVMFKAATQARARIMEILGCTIVRIPLSASLKPQSHRIYDFWIVRLVAIGPRCDQSAMFATISSSSRIPRSISTRGRAFTNDWRISMARAIVGNRATSGSDQRPMYDQS